MYKSINICTQLFLLGVLICLTNAVSLRHKRNVIAEYHWPEPDPNIDQFPHESSCHHYYLVLSKEDIVVQKCPHGELFDYKEHKCKEKESAKCFSRHFGKMTNHHTLLQSDGPFTCPYAWGKYPDVNNCTNYYVCLNGKVKHKKCASFEHFDKVSRKCVAAIEGVCADNTDIVESTYKCPRSWGSYSYHKDCSKYYECLEKHPNLRTCPTQTLFHEKKHKCLPRNRVHCGSRHNPYSKKEEHTTNSEIISTSENSEEATSEPKVGNEIKPDVNTPSVEVKEEKVTASEDAQKATNESIKTSVEKESEVNASSAKEIEAETASTAEDSHGATSQQNKTNVGNESKPDANISLKKEIEKPKSTYIPLTSQSQLNDSIIAEELPSSFSKDEASTPSKENLDALKLSTKETISNEIVPVVASKALKNITENDSDEIEDSNEEFIEVSTGSQSTTAADNQPTSTISLSENKDAGTTIVKTVQGTTMESIQATPTEECPPKDATCIMEDGGSVIRCPSQDGIYPYPSDEKRLIECKGKEIRVKYCPGETIFSFSEKKCVAKLIFA